MPKDLLSALGTPAEDGGDDMDAKGVAAKDLLSAVESKDVDALADAFQRLYDACAMADVEMADEMEE